MNLNVGKRAIDTIIAAEISSDAYYNKYLQVPNWPGGSSGVTIGVGYDLGYNSASQITKDWGNRVSKDTLDKLVSVAGYKGQNALNRLHKLSGIKIPLDIAKQVFTLSLIKFASSSVNTFPGLDKLTPDAVGAIISLVYNRGTAMTMSNDKEDSRREMREIKKLIPTKDYEGIAKQLSSMKRLWDGIPDYPGDNEKRFGGLLTRRDNEAKLVRESNRQYSQNEIVTLTF